MVKLYSKLSVRAAWGRPVRADHGRSHGRLALLPEGVLAEDEVGQVERQPRGLPDPHLQRETRQPQFVISDIPVTSGFGIGRQKCGRNECLMSMSIVYGPEIENLTCQ